LSRPAVARRRRHARNDGRRAHSPASRPPSPRRRRLDGRAVGAVAVEYALTVPILLLFFVGIIETGRVVYADTTLAAATRDGTRYAIVHGAEHPSPATATQIADYVKSKATALDTDVLTVTVVHTPDNSPGSVVTLQTTYAFRFLLPPFSGEQPDQHLEHGHFAPWTQALA
jgi:Flp pilus assembly protein TadG